MRDTAAVVVTYNRIDLLKECIAHLQNQTYPVDIIVVDNASTDGTSDFFIDSQDNLYYFNTGANLGGAGGFNYGMRKAVEMGYKFVWVMDDDTMPTETAHEKLIESDNKLNGQYGFLSSKVLWKDETPCNMNIQKITKWKKLDDFDNNHSVQYASFVSLFLKSETIKEFGLPYKEFFIWSDDWEYTRRISKKFESYYIADSVVKHCCNSNTGANIVTAPEDRMDRFIYLYRNDVVLYRLDGIDGFVYMFIRTLVHLIKVLLKANNKWRKMKIILSSIREGKKFHPEIEYVGR